MPPRSDIEAMDRPERSVHCAVSHCMDWPG